MKFLYFLLWWNADRELTIAMNTGRNPRNIKQRQDDVRRFKVAYFKETIKWLTN